MRETGAVAAVGLVVVVVVGLLLLLLPVTVACDGGAGTSRIFSGTALRSILL